MPNADIPHSLLYMANKTMHAGEVSNNHLNLPEGQELESRTSIESRMSIESRVSIAFALSPLIGSFQGHFQQCLVLR